MADEKKLDIGIKITADTAGAAQTNAALVDIGKTAADTAAKVSDAVSKETTAEKAQSDIRKAAGETAKRVQKEQKEAADEASKSTSGLSKELGSLKEAGSGANQVLSGLNQGGLTGLVTAARGATTVLRSLASGTIGAVMIPVVAAAGAALLLLNRRAKQNEDAIKQAFESHARVSEAYAAKLELVKKSSEASLKAMVKQVEELTKSYADLNEQIDTAYKRQSTLSPAKRDANRAKLEADQAEALAKAGSPEAKAKINAEFEAKKLAADTSARFADFDNVKNEALVRRGTAEDEIKGKDKAVADAKKKVAEAEKELREKQDALEQFNDPQSKAYTSEEAQNARKDAFTAQEKLKSANENVTTVEAKNKDETKAARATIAESNLAIEKTNINRQQFQAELRKKQTDLAQGDPELAKNTKAASDALAETDAAIKKRKNDAFLGAFGTEADTTDLEQERATRQAALDQAQHAQANDRTVRAQQSHAITTEVEKDKARQTEVQKPDPNKLSIAEDRRSSSITENRTGKTSGLKGPREGPGFIKDSGGALVLNELTEPGKGTAVVGGLAELTAALIANTAALKASGGGGAAPAGVAAAADSVKQGTDATVDALGELAKSGDKLKKESEKVAVKQRNDRERSGGG